MNTSLHPIATRTLEILDDVGTVVGHAEVRLGQPTQEAAGEWSIAYQIIGLGDDTVRRLLGIDAIQVLQLVQGIIGSILSASKDRLRWAGERDLGFPGT